MTWEERKKERKKERERQVERLCWCSSSTLLAFLAPPVRQAVGDRDPDVSVGRPLDPLFAYHGHCRGPRLAPSRMHFPYKPRGTISRFLVVLLAHTQPTSGRAAARVSRRPRPAAGLAFDASRSLARRAVRFALSPHAPPPLAPLSSRMNAAPGEENQERKKETYGAGVWPSPRPPNVHFLRLRPLSRQPRPGPLGLRASFPSPGKALEGPRPRLCGRGGRGGHIALHLSSESCPPQSPPPRWLAGWHWLAGWQRNQAQILSRSRRYERCEPLTRFSAQISRSKAAWMG